MTVNNGTKQQPQTQLRRGQSLRKPNQTNLEKPNTNYISTFLEKVKQQLSIPEVEQSHQEFSILKTLHTGEFSKIYLARPELGTCKKSLEQALVLKAFNSNLTNVEDFFCEMELNYFLSPHPNIVTSYNVPCNWNNFNIYPQEHAPYGDLSRFIKKECILQETQVKAVAQQLACALEFIHSLELVHRDVVPENVLVFQKDLSLVKLSDFGSMVTSRSLLTKCADYCNDTTNCNNDEDGATTSDTDSSGIRPRTNSNSKTGGGQLAFVPPEICGILPQEKYHCYPSIDVWQMGMLLFACLTGGNSPWRSADPLRDTGFNHYCDWVKRRCIKTPLSFQPFSSRLTRLLKRMLEPKPTKRCRIQEVSKYLKDDWIDQTYSSKSNFGLNSNANLSGIGKGMEKSPSFSSASGLVSRSNSDNQKTQGKLIAKKPSNMSLKRKSERVKRPVKNSNDSNANCAEGERKEPVFRICCHFQCKKQAIRT